MRWLLPQVTQDQRFKYTHARTATLVFLLQDADQLPGFLLLLILRLTVCGWFKPTPLNQTTAVSPSLGLEYGLPFPLCLDAPGQGTHWPFRVLAASSVSVLPRFFSGARRHFPVENIALFSGRVTSGQDWKWAQFGTGFM